MNSMNEIDGFVKLLMQAEKILEDFSELSKKKPNDAVNKFKLRFVNTILEQANNILDEANKPFDSFNTFDEHDIPTNSDVVLILTQYLGCLKKFGRDNTAYSGVEHYWVIKGKRSDIKADFDRLRDT
jgi:hypothetical protein